MHPFFRIFFTMLIASVVGAVLLNILFRDGDETDRSVEQCSGFSLLDLFWRGKFGFLVTVVLVAGIGSFMGLPLLWEYLKSLLSR
jgi:hypothetical protein